MFAMPLDKSTYEMNIKLAYQSNNRVIPLWWIENGAFDMSATGYKFHGAYEKLPINDDKYKLLLEYCQDYKKVVLVHCGMFEMGNPLSNTSYVHVVDVAKRYPNAKFIMGHMGGSIEPIIRKAILAGAQCHNIWLDTSGITSPSPIEFAVHNFPIERILFGSDAPWCTFIGALSNVSEAIITDTQKVMILRDNFERLISSLDI